MHLLRRTPNSLRPRHAFIVMMVLAPPIAVLIISYADKGSISSDTIFFSIGAAALGVILATLMVLANRTPPLARNRKVISMDLDDVIYEYVHLGYKVEAMTNNTVVLVRIRIPALLFLIFLAIITPTLVFFRLVAMKSAPETYGLAALFLSMISLFAVAFFVIAGYGYDRLVFHRANNPSKTTVVLDIKSFLPSRIRRSVEFKKEYPLDEHHRTRRSSDSL